MVVGLVVSGLSGTTLYSLERTPKRVPEKKKKTITNNPGKTFPKAPAPPTCLLNQGNNKKSSPVKGQSPKTTSLSSADQLGERKSKPAVEMPGSDSMPVLDIQFGSVDWKEVEREDSSASPSAPKLESKVNTGKFRRVNRKEWKNFSEQKPKNGLLGGGPKREWTRTGQLLEASAKVTAEKRNSTSSTALLSPSKKKSPSASVSGQGILPPACPSPDPSIASSLDRRLISLTEDNCKGDAEVEDSVKGSVVELDDFTDSEYLAKARSNKFLKFENRGNQCALSTALHLLLDQPKIRESILAKRKDHALCQNLNFLLVDDNQQDSLGEILELLGLQPGIQHDQHEVLFRLLDGLVKDCKLDKNLFSSYRFQTVRCHQCHHRFDPEEENYEILRLNIKPNEDTERMSRLVDRQMTVCDDECPKCKTDNVMRVTNPNLTTTPDYLLAIIMRYTIENDLTRKINVKVKEADSFIYVGRTYELCGFTVHTGTGNSGHYRAYHASGVEYDDQGGTSPTLRKISPERLEKLKEYGYIYLYKKKSRPSESCPEAVPSEPSIEDSGEPMDLSTPSKSPESGIPLDLSTPSSRASLTDSPGPLSSIVDTGKEKCLSTSSSGPRGVNLNDWMTRPVLKTPSKALKRVTPSQSPLSSAKMAKVALPSPGKRYLEKHPEISRDGESPQPSQLEEADPFDQVQEISQFLLNQEKGITKDPTIVLHQGCFGDECWFIGEEGKTRWERDTETLFVMIPAKEKILMIRNKGPATASQLKSLLITKFSLPFVLPCLSFRGESLTQQTLSSYKNKTLVLSDGAYPEKHSGCLWSCTKCCDKEGFMEGRLKRRDYEKKHNSSSCLLFMSSQLMSKGGPVSKLGWGNSQDRPTNKTPYGCPKGHCYIDVDTPSNNNTTSISSDNETAVHVKISLATTSVKGNVRPTRAVAERRKRIIEDSDVDDVDLNTSQELGSDPNLSDKEEKKQNLPSKIQGKRYVKVDYEAPEAIKDQCLEEQKKRHKKMDTSLRTKAPSDHWIPDAQDEEDEKTIFIARDMVNQRNWAQAKYEMNPESRERMKKGLLPLIEEDKIWVTQTPSLYKPVRRKLFFILQRELGINFHIRNLFDFGQDSLVKPLLDMPDLIRTEFPATRQNWAYSIWLHILGLQLKGASKYRQKFRAGIKNIENLSPGEIEDEITRQELQFRTLCDLAIRELKSSDMSKQIGRERAAITQRRKKDQEEFMGQSLPGAAETIPQFFNHPKTQAFYKQILHHACTPDEPIEGKTLSKISNFMLVNNMIQGCQRSEIWGKMKKAAILRALGKPLSYFPYELAKEQDFEDPDSIQAIQRNFGFRENRNAQPDLPEDADQDVREALQGYCVEVEAHKTGNKESAFVWLSQGQMVLIKAYMAIVDKYVEHNPQYTYPTNGPLFVNQYLRQFFNKGNLDFSIMAEISGVNKFGAHNPRRMFASYVGVSKSIILQQAGALASNHSHQTQQSSYITPVVQQTLRVYAQHWVRERILKEQSSGIISREVKFSDKSQKKIVSDMIEELRTRDESFFKRKEAEDRLVKAKPGEIIHTEIKHAIFSLLIKLGDKDGGLNKILGVHLYKHFFTGRSLKDQYTKELMMMLIDWGLHNKMDDAETLLENILQYCQIYAEECEDEDCSIEDLRGRVEMNWTEKIVNIFRNAHNEHNTQDMEARLIRLLSRFNAKEDFKYCFQNDNLKRNFDKYAKFKGDQIEAAKAHGKGGISADDAQKQLVEKTKELCRLEDMKKQRKKDKESAEIDLQAMTQNKQVEGDMDYEVPESSEYIKQVITPSKTGVTTLKGQGISIQLKEPMAVVEQSPYKQLTSHLTVDDDAVSQNSRGFNWNDEMKLQLLQAWIQWAEEPFHEWTKGSKEGKDKARKTIELLIATGKSMIIDGQKILFKEISSKFDTYWEKLTKPRNGFSFDLKKKALISYIDDEMMTRRGLPSRTLWTREFLRSIEANIVSKIKDKMGQED